jgi:hypothetical protein
MKTKEKLLSENAELSASVQAWSNGDSTMRQRFSKVIGRTDDRYGIGRNTPSDLSWEEIFCEVGKLIAFQDFRRWKDDIEFRFDALKSEVQKPSPVS